jgi:DNA-binding NarL/FixJ family response regulator
VLADDDERFRTIVRGLLESDGYRVLAETADVASTLRADADHHPDVVVLDLVMEGAHGLSGVEDLLAADPRRPVVVISSLFDPLVERQALELGAWYVEKVDGFEALEQAIDKAVSVRHTA